MHEQEVRPYRNNPDIRAAMDELRAAVPDVPERSRKDVEDAVNALETELNSNPPDPNSVQGIISKLQQSGGQVAEVAERLLNTTAIQTILYHSDGPTFISQEADSPQ